MNKNILVFIIIGYIYKQTQTNRVIGWVVTLENLL